MSTDHLAIGPHVHQRSSTGRTMGSVMLALIPATLVGLVQFGGPAVFLFFLELTLIPGYRGFLLAILPPGGFIALGFILAGKRILDRRLQKRSLAATAGEAVT